MIDTIGRGIRKVFTERQKRFFPMPDFQYLHSFVGATRAELNTLLQSKLSDVLTEEQKIRKIGNMLFALKKSGVIKLIEKKKWVLVELLVKV